MGVRRRLPLRKEPRFCTSLSIITASTAMYLLGIKGCGLTSMLFFLGLSLLLTIQEAESGMLMSKGIGRMRGGGRQYKPWDTMSGVNRQGGLSVENTEEEDSPQIYYNYPPEPARREPCVGICQYYRSLGIENPYDRNIKRNF